MRIAICSDSHNGMFHIDAFRDFCNLANVDQVFHLGDMVEDARVLARELDAPVAYVAGNCDYFATDVPAEKLIELEGHRILICHGHRWSVKMQMNSLSYHAEELKASIVCFGHTHRQFCGYVGNTLLINPGALKDGNIAVLELTQTDIVPRMLDVDVWLRDQK